MAKPSFYALAMELAAKRAAGASYAKLAKASGWQENSVRYAVSHARRGLLRPPGSPRKGGWTPEMDALLVERWETWNSKRIALALTRLYRPTSWWAVNARARRKGLSKPGACCDWWSEKMEVFP